MKKLLVLLFLSFFVFGFSQDWKQVFYLVEMQYVTPDSIGEGLLKTFCEEN